MIYVASLAAYAKKTFGEKAFQTNMDKIMNTISLDPKSTGMNLVVIGPKDLSVARVKDLIKAKLEIKHKDILVIYMYVSEKQGKYLEGCNVVSQKVRRINLKTFASTVNYVIDNKDIIKKNVFELQELKKEKEEKLQKTNIDKLKQDESHIDPVIYKKTKIIEERIKDCLEFADWDLFKNLLQRDTIVSELSVNNSKYAETINMLDLLDKEITMVFKDQDKTEEERFEKIKEIGIKRAGYKATANNIIIQKVISIITSMTISAENTVDSRINSIKETLGILKNQSKMYYKKDKEQIDKLINERLDIQFQLHQLSKNLISLYSAMDETTLEVAASLEEGLPSENRYINELYSGKEHLFTPNNITIMAKRLMNDLSKNRIALSDLEDKIQNLISNVFQLCELDDEIISYQNKLIKLLEANQVEDVVIVDTVLKNALRIYVGANEVGTRSTAITWAGILSRRQNSVIIDLTGNEKFREYGIEPISLETFINNKVEKQFVCVEGVIQDDIEENQLDHIIKQLKLKLSYYPYINIILDTTQSGDIQKLVNHALSITYITDCTKRSNKLLKQAMDNIKNKNVANKIVMIDTQVEPSIIMEELNIDPLTTQLITIPYLPKMKTYNIKGIAPFNDIEILNVFEQAFRQ